MFEHISTLFEWLQSLAIVIGVAIAWRQLGSWRNERLSLKLSELGEELIMATNVLEQKISSVRHPFGYVAPEDDDDKDTYDYRRRLLEIEKLAEDFAKLQQFKIRQNAFIGDTDTDAAIDVFFDARVKLVIALRGMIYKIQSEKRQTKAQRKNDDQYDQVIWENYSDEDTLKNSLEEATEKIQAKMIPYLRMK